MSDKPASPPCLFMTLPLELRQEVYYYALLGPPSYGIPQDFIHIETAGSKIYDTYYWGSEQMTRLLRVNRQIHHEAEEVLYTRFQFGFPLYVRTQLVHDVLDPLSARARSLIRRVGLYIVLRTFPGPGAKQAAPLWKDAFALLVRLLPGLREAKLAIGFVGGDVPESQRGQVVELALRIASPLRNIEELKVSAVSDYEGQRLETIRDIVERIRAGIW
ncbi:hypothetical protein MMC16_005136 [Acarospora aff. strigata]|nr:hypothetical protein [Acarospora aff. strigata]